MLTFYLVVTAFLAGIMISFRFEDIQYLLSKYTYLTPEETFWSWMVVGGSITMVVLWPLLTIIAFGGWIHETYLNGFKRP